MIPNSYQSWRHCIERDCGVPLTASFIEQRLLSLQDLNDFRTEQFVRLYGADHRANVLTWFQQALADLRASNRAQGS